MRMDYSFTPVTPGWSFYAWWDGAFTKEELDHLQELAKRANDPAKVGGNRLDASVRRSSLSWLPANEEYFWFFKKLDLIAHELNAEYFHFDLTGFGEAVQLTQYSSVDQGEYNWHEDSGGVGPSRKLSVVMQLSDPLEYEGGQLELLVHGKPVVIEKKRGFITMFPSFVTHRVTPVTAGTRQSAVCWISGPPLR